MAKIDVLCRPRFIVRPDQLSSDYRESIDQQAVFFLGIDGVDRRVCRVPDGFHRSMAHFHSPAFRIIHQCGPKGCNIFTEEYDSHYSSVTDPDISDKDASFMFRQNPFLAKRNPVFPLWAICNPRVADEIEQRIVSAEWGFAMYGMTGPLAEWPEKRIDIESIRFPESWLALG